MTARLGRGWIAAVSLALAGCNAIAGISSGQRRQAEPCAEVSDCKIAVPGCRAAACAAGVCVYDDAPAGTVLDEQAPGDCAQRVCDGAGNEKKLPLPSDLPDDGNPCTEDRCTNEGPENTPAGAVVACYSGPPLTLSQGICAPGLLHCSDAGEPLGACEGEIMPRLEICDEALLDEDCDGQVNEEGPGCLCHPGEIEPCYTGPAGTQDVGLCHGGKRACLADGRTYGPCLGEEKPSPEDCEATASDEDCDGLANEEGPSCLCGDGYLSTGEACDDGNASADDACNPSCGLSGCGDGYLQAGESCDDGNASAEDGCNPNCTLSGCGDGYLQAGESCDDGNTTGGDGCPAICRFAAVQVAAGGGHSCALLDEGRVKCWGQGGSGQLGLGDGKDRGDDPGEMGPALPMVDLGKGAVAVMLAVGDAHSCALLASGAVKCWGKNNSGALGLEDTASRGLAPGQMGDNLPAVKLGTGKKAVAIALGFVHSCALLDDGAVKCWGRNFEASLGFGGPNQGDGTGEMGDALPAVNLGTGKKAVAIAAGLTHSCALLDDGGVKCWGGNDGGQLGLGDSEPRGLFPDEMGDALPEIYLGSGETAFALATGDDHTCARIGAGLKCWGVNGQGQLGQGNTAPSLGSMPGQMANLPVIELAGPVVASTGGEQHTCALLLGGGVQCWGDNAFGQLGLGDALDRGRGAGEMGPALPLVNLGTKADGSARMALQVDAGRAHTCAVLEEGYVKCWGENAHGQLGVGDELPRGDTQDETGDGLAVVPF